jgi:UDP-N-acetylglucosamine 1-carboxyvinyltransferase
MGFLIDGGRKLDGTVLVQGSKNSVLPILAATLLIKGESVIHNCPDITDVDAALDILGQLGCAVTRQNRTVTVDASCVNSCRITDALMCRIRSSILFLGPILSRTGRAEFSSPGGCEIGLRPIDLHLSSIRQLGATVTDEYGTVKCSAPNGLKGTRIHLSFPSVGATENILLSSVLASGTTVLSNAAREPEIVDLSNFLIGAGAKISGAGESTVIIQGVGKLHSTEHTVIPDRIVSATYLFAAAVTGGRVVLEGVAPEHLDAVYPVLSETGCRVRTGENRICLSAPDRLKRIKTVRTMPYPGFPTDLQSPVTALASVADGTSVITETIFENRYKYISELNRLGANIRVEGRTAIVEGVKKLHGAAVNATDLRGGFALVIAALAADGETVINNTSHIDRGYESPESYLSSLGANIKRIAENEHT